MRQQRAEVAAGEIDLAAEQRCGQVAGALVWNRHGGGLRQLEDDEQVVRPEVLQRAGADGRIVELAGPLLHVVDEILHRPVARFAPHRSHVRIHLEHRQVREVAPLVRRLLIGRRQDHLRGDAREQKRVAVRRRLAHRRSTDGAGGAGLVDDDDLMRREIFLRMLRQIARREVGIASGAERNDDRYGFGRVFRVQRSAREGEQGKGAGPLELHSFFRRYRNSSASRGERSSGLILPSSSRTGSLFGSSSTGAVPTKRSFWPPLETLLSSRSCRYLRAWRTTLFGTPASPATCRP